MFIDDLLTVKRLLCCILFQVMASSALIPLKINREHLVINQNKY
jgi:hypothetical protein